MKDNRNFKPNNKKNNFKKFDNKPKTNNKKVQEKFPKRTEEKEESFSDQIEGRNSVLELLESGKDINKIFIEKGEKHGSINKIIGIAKDRKIVIVEVDRNKLNQMAQTENPQGVIAIVPPFNYCEVDDILNEAKSKNEAPFILILDGIEDPHNLGAIIRTAETAGVHGIIIPKRRACSVNSTVYKVASGAVEHVKIARVNNLNDEIKYLKSKDVWIYGTAIEATKYYYEENLKGAVALVIGNEGEGISRLVRENCDILLKIPMKGHITSLNASVSAGIVMYEVVKQRM
jgi:23S rRNA (guanosine2251-2'-O)-methyltransferase